MPLLMTPSSLNDAFATAGIPSCSGVDHDAAVVSCDLAHDHHDDVADDTTHSTRPTLPGSIAALVGSMEQPLVPHVGFDCDSRMSLNRCWMNSDMT